MNGGGLYRECALDCADVNFGHNFVLMNLEVLKINLHLLSKCIVWQLTIHPV